MYVYTVYIYIYTLYIYIYTHTYIQYIYTYENGVGMGRVRSFDPAIILQIRTLKTNKH